MTLEWSSSSKAVGWSLIYMPALHLAMTQAHIFLKKVMTSLILRNTTMWVKTDTYMYSHVHTDQPITSQKNHPREWKA